MMSCMSSYYFLRQVMLHVKILTVCHKLNYDCVSVLERIQMEGNTIINSNGKLLA